ncbi:universal stress protein [Mucilaginibacter sp. UR6-11]|uniref:universal stress protein n=1 Tax=Mucilaginibacter sp. UR6-11 TaxID=1435644 RepID=UPI001E376E03|nr:universal stress protein [Mucilaginibacter sp. UR6-11]MCC8425514.1 universal stress protein [Mucilaginibacter sp. UR6-11]
MKKISAAFDGLKFSKATLDYAIDLVTQSQAMLTGVFLEDFLYHSFNLYDMIGSQGISSTKLKHLVEKDKATRQQAVESFKQSCEHAGIDYTIHQDDRFAIDDLLKESIYSDLVLIGAQETLSHFPAEKPTPFVKELLAGTPCPVMVLPRTYHAIERVVILYDGHPSSVFAIKMFNYLMPFLRKLPTEIVFVSEDTSLKKLPDDQLIKEFIRCHYPDAAYTLLAGEPEQTLATYLKKLSPNVMVVMGAYNRGAVSRMFKTSMADKLISAVEDVPVFIAHHQ